MQKKANSVTTVTKLVVQWYLLLEFLNIHMVLKTNRYSRVLPNALRTKKQFHESKCAQPSTSLSERFDSQESAGVLHAQAREGSGQVNRDRGAQRNWNQQQTVRQHSREEEKSVRWPPLAQPASCSSPSAERRLVRLHEGSLPERKDSLRSSRQFPAPSFPFFVGLPPSEHCSQDLLNVDARLGNTATFELATEYTFGEHVEPSFGIRDLLTRPGLSYMRSCQQAVTQAAGSSFFCFSAQAFTVDELVVAHRSKTTLRTLLPANLRGERRFPSTTRR